MREWSSPSLTKCDLISRDQANGDKDIRLWNGGSQRSQSKVWSAELLWLGQPPDLRWISEAAAGFSAFGWMLLR